MEQIIKDKTEVYFILEDIHVSKNCVYSPRVHSIYTSIEDAKKELTQVVASAKKEHPVIKTFNDSTKCFSSPTGTHVYLTNAEGNYYEARIQKRILH